MKDHGPSVTINYESRQVPKRRVSQPSGPKPDAVQVAMGAVLVMFAVLLLVAGAFTVMAAVVEMAGR